MYNAYMQLMDEDITTVVRIPITRLEDDIRKKHSIALALQSVSLEKDAVVLRFGGTSFLASNQPRNEGISSQTSLRGVEERYSSEIEPVNPNGTCLIELAPRVRRRRPSRRNRMKTRGWNIVTKITNSRGQTVTIYEPFVAALRGKRMSRKQMENAVATVLKENGNRPGPVSIDYYLSNTLEYLAKEGNA